MWCFIITIFCKSTEQVSTHHKGSLQLIYFLCILHLKLHCPLFFRSTITAADQIKFLCKHSSFGGSVHQSVWRVSASEEGWRRKQDCVAIVSPVIKFYNRSILNQSRYRYERDELDYFIVGCKHNLPN